MKKVLLDENLDKRLKNYFSPALDVNTVPDLGWQAKKNGELLSAMSSEGLNCLLTADKNLRFQQNLDKFAILVVVLLTVDTRLTYLAQHAKKIEKAILEADLQDRIVEIDLRSN